MFQRIGIACALALMGTLHVPTITSAKPADLPGDVTQQCPEGRDGQQAEGFAPRPFDLQPQIIPPWPRTQPDRARPDPDAAEEQDTPPRRPRHREGTEGRRRAESPPQPEFRESQRQSGDDARRLEMLRSTEPLDTQIGEPIHYDAGLATQPISCENSEAIELDENGAADRTETPREGKAGSSVHGLFDFDWSAFQLPTLQPDHVVRGFIDWDGTIKTTVSSPAGFDLFRPLDFLSLQRQHHAPRMLAQCLGHVTVDFRGAAQPVWVLVYPSEATPAAAPPEHGIHGDFEIGTSFFF